MEHSDACLENQPPKSSTSFSFCCKERSFHIVNIQIVIKLEDSFKGEFVAKTSFIAEFRT